MSLSSIPLSAADSQVLTFQSQEAQANHFHAEILAQVAEAVIAVDESNQITYLNASAERLYGLHASDALGRPQEEVLSSPWFKAEDELAVAIALRNHGVWTGENSYMASDGREMCVELTITPLKDKEGRANGRVVVIRDESSRKKTEGQLLGSEIWQRRLFETTREGILIVDAGTRKIVDANPFMIDLLGYPHADLVGMEVSVLGLFTDAQVGTDTFQTLEAMGQLRYEKLPLRTQHGALCAVEVLANRYDEDGRGVIHFNIREIVERRRTEAGSDERRHFLSRIVDVLPGVLYIFDLDENRTVYVKNMSEGSYTSEEIADMGPEVARRLMHPDDWLCCTNRLTAGLRLLPDGLVLRAS